MQTGVQRFSFAPPKTSKAKALHSKHEITMNQTPPSNRWKFIVLGFIAFICLGGLSLTVIVAGVFLGTNINRITKKPVATPAPRPTPQPYNQIAYIGNDNNVWLIAPDGTKKRQLTTDSQIYRLLTWSPDNQQLAFTGSEVGDSTKTVLFTSPVDHSDPQVIFRDESAIYLYWSPNSQALTFLTQGSTDLALRQVDLFPPQTARLLGQGSPYYWAWSPQNDRLLMHLNSGTKKAELAMLANEKGQEAVEFKVDVGKFQAPLWAADGQHVFYVVTDGKRRGILYQAKINANNELAEQTMMVRLKGPTYMVQSPDGQRLFYLQLQRRNEPPFGTAYMLDIKNNASQQLTDMPIASAYWSPDGKKLALLTLGRGLDKGNTAKVAGLAAPLPQEVFHRWWVYYVETGRLEVLKTFNPTAEFKETIPYFDQYALSQTYWSPDSRYFLIAEQDAKTPTQGKIWLADTTFEEDVRELAEGKIAVWSWR